MGADDADAEDDAEAAVDSDEASALSSLTVARRDEGRDDGREGEATGEDSCLGVSCGTRLGETQGRGGAFFGRRRRLREWEWQRPACFANRSSVDSQMHVSYQECRLRASSRRSGPLATASFCEAIRKPATERVRLSSSQRTRWKRCGTRAVSVDERRKTKLFPFLIELL